MPAVHSSEGAALLLLLLLLFVVVVVFAALSSPTGAAAAAVVVADVVDDLEEEEEKGSTSLVFWTVLDGCSSVLFAKLTSTYSDAASTRESTRRPRLLRRRTLDDDDDAIFFFGCRVKIFAAWILSFFSTFFSPLSSRESPHGGDDPLTAQAPQRSEFVAPRENGTRKERRLFLVSRPPA